MAFGNSDFNEILTTTFNKVHPQFVDNIFKARPLGYFLMKSGQVVPVGGGAAIQESIIGAENTTVGSHAAWDALTVAQTTEITSAKYDWKAHSATVSIAGLEEAQNSGAEAILDLLKVKIDVAKESIVADLNTMFYGDGTGNSGKDMNGLANLLGQNTAAVGGIDPSDVDNDWWQSQIQANPVSTTLTRALMTTAFNNASVGADQPGFLLTTQALFEAYEGLMQANIRYTSTEMADAGFQALEFKGRPVLYDDDCATGQIWHINPKYLRLKVHKDKFMKPSPFITPRDYDVRTMKLTTYGNLTVNNRSRHSLQTNLVP